MVQKLSLGAFLGERYSEKKRITNERRKFASLKITKCTRGTPNYEVRSRDINGKVSFS